MKIYIEHEISDDPNYCGICDYRDRAYCNIFLAHLSRDIKFNCEPLRCEECQYASKKASLSVVYEDVCECTCG